MAGDGFDFLIILGVLGFLGVMIFLITLAVRSGAGDSAESSATPSDASIENGARKEPGFEDNQPDPAFLTAIQQKPPGKRAPVKKPSRQKPGLSQSTSATSTEDSRNEQREQTPLDIAPQCSAPSRDAEGAIAPPAPPAAPKTLFVCYRRDDTADVTGRLYDQLQQRYGAERVFMDIDSVPLGVNFVEHIKQQLQGCAAVLVVIGRTWTAITDADGNRRLGDVADHVRVEVTAALKQGVPVIPVLVQNAAMPRPADLPDDIRELAFHNGIKLSPEFWRAGVERLIKELDRVMKPATGP